MTTIHSSHMESTVRRELRTEAAAVQVDMPEITTLNAALSALTDWQVCSSDMLTLACG